MWAFWRLALTLIIGVGGWYGGAKYGAPDSVVTTIDNSISAIASRFQNDRAQDSKLINPDVKSATPLSTNNEPATQTSQSSNAKLPVDRPPSSRAQPTPTTRHNPINLCRTNVSNAPTNSNGVVAGATDAIDVNGIEMLMAPATKSCLSSGFGLRGFSPHRGVDYYSDSGGDAFAAADGVIIERLYRDDYGNMVLIEHGKGVYSRYAHLAEFADGIDVGARVSGGQILGVIGASGAAQAIHLHYEIRTGDYDNPKRSFGLIPIDPFTGDRLVQ